MSEDTDFDLDDETTEQEETETRNPARDHQRKLEKELKQAKQDSRAKDAELAEAKAAQRELALMKAGIDTSQGAGKLFAKSYDGDLTDEAIKAQAEEYGLIATSQTSEVKAELAQLGQVAKASSGSSAGTVPASVVDDIRSATTEAEVLAAYAKHGISISTEQPGDPYSIV